MQRVKTQATAAGVVDGVREKMVEVDEQASEHDQVALDPGLPEEHERNGERGDEVECQVKNGWLPECGFVDA